ncbi:FtsJ-like methyltransferase-domain-containing protein [Xylariomycetidae sp. FL2044]|nr:FtsJ-like methyltransferase-domain-containing protein [Xylariomycetidae sp. FL2044]
MNIGGFQSIKGLSLATLVLMRALSSISEPHHGRLVRSIAAAAVAAPVKPFIAPARPVTFPPHQPIQYSAAAGGPRWSSSNSRWKQRQGNDFYSREAKVKGLKSRAAFKLLEMDSRYKLFKRGQTVVDLGYAPGSWSQVAVERTKPNGRVVGIDILPAQPPKGVSTIQGNFLSPQVQNLVKEYLVEYAPARRSPKTAAAGAAAADEQANDDEAATAILERPSYIDTERAAGVHHHGGKDQGLAENQEGKLVDIVLSDMSEPWMQTAGFSSNTLTNPYHRMMNTSGMGFRDHAGSMDLCYAALQFASDTLRTGGHFVCKFYQGAEDKDLFLQLKKMFTKVHREKPDSSRSESKEAYFVALGKKAGVTLPGAEGHVFLNFSRQSSAKSNPTHFHTPLSLAEPVYQQHHPGRLVISSPYLVGPGGEHSLLPP